MTFLSMLDVYGIKYHRHLALRGMSSKLRSPKWRTLGKMSCYWVEEYATSQLRCSIMRTVNKFLLA